MGERRIVVKAPAKLPSLQIGFHVPAINNAQADWEPYALEVLAGVLSGNAAARLNQNLVRSTQVAINADAGYSILSRGRLAQFELYATPSKGKTVADIEKALFEELDKVKATGVTVEELNRVKAGVIASEVYQRDSMFYQGMQMGTVETAGFSWKTLDIYASKIRAVTSAQVIAVAKRYLVKDNMTVAILDPQPLDPNAKPKGQPHMH